LANDGERDISGKEYERLAGCMAAAGEAWRTAGAFVTAACRENDWRHIGQPGGNEHDMRSNRRMKRLAQHIAARG